MKTSRQEKQLSYQNQNRKNYFEGWYFKQVSEDESVILSVIPSMMRSDNYESAMLQVLIAENINSKWNVITEQVEFPISAFEHSKEPFKLEVGTNTFSKDGMSIDVKTSNIELECEISFSQFKVLPTTAMSPTIMGPFSYLPFMECIHGVVSLHHYVKGYAKINKRLVSFNNGIGYIEKDWGKSFPKAYVWLQSNHFNSRPASLFFSWANIPLGPFEFPGFICNLWYEGNHYRFATYNLASCTIEDMTQDKISLILRKKSIKLSLKATVKNKGVLSAPKDGKMNHQIKEGLSGTIAFCLEDEKTGMVISDESSISGVEITTRLISKN